MLRYVYNNMFTATIIQVFSLYNNNFNNLVSQKTGGIPLLIGERKREKYIIYFSKWNSHWSVLSRRHWTRLQLYESERRKKTVREWERMYGGKDARCMIHSVASEIMEITRPVWSPHHTRIYIYIHTDTPADCKKVVLSSRRLPLLLMLHWTEPYRK